MSWRLFFRMTLFGAVFASGPVGASLANGVGQLGHGWLATGGEYNPDTLNAVYGSDYIYPSDGDVSKGYPNNKEYAFYRSKNMGIVRLAFDIRRLQPNNLQAFNTAELNRIRTQVSLIEAQGQKVILDPHTYGYMWSNALGDYDLIITTAMKNNFNDFWRRLAQAFASDANVIFGIMNEPQDDYTAGQWRTAAVGAVNTIRSVETAAQRHVILIPGIGWTNAGNWSYWGNDVAWAGYSDPVGGPWAFEMHQYLDSDSSGTNSQCVSGSGNRLNQATNWAITNHYQIFLGEFAFVNSRSCNTQATTLLNYIRANPTTWVGWTWCCGGPWIGDNLFNLYNMDYNPPRQGSQWGILGNYLP